MRVWSVVLALAACSDKPTTPADPIAPGSGGSATAPADATQRATAAADPGGGRHLDDDPTRFSPTGQAGARADHPIDITLRSTPSGAQASVDGIVIGPTPTFWSGSADGREHEFVFVAPGFAMARYRFVPITSGVIHARLEPIVEDVDAGVAPGGSAAVAPAAPTTIVSPPADPSPTRPAAPRVGAGPIGPQP